MKRKLLLGMALLGLCSAQLHAAIMIDTLDLNLFPPYGDANVQAGIVDAITEWNVTHNPDLPLTGIGAVPDIKVAQGGSVPGFPSFGDDTYSITIPVGGYTYVFLHFGGENADEPYLNPQLWYVGGDSGSVTFNAPLDANGHRYGLSFYSLYGSVPDGASTLALAGLAFTALGVLRRKIS